MVENTLNAISLELKRRPPPLSLLRRYRRASVILDMFLAHARAFSSAERDIPPDLLDETTFSTETRHEIEEASTEISRRWKVITDLRPEDFAEALRAAGG